MAEGLLTVNESDYLTVSWSVINQILKGPSDRHSDFLFCSVLV